MDKLRKILEIQDNILMICGIFFAIRLIYTKEIYIETDGYTINTLKLLIQTIVLVTISRIYIKKKTSEEIKHK